MADLSVFSKRLREVRRSAGLSQSELAKLAGTTSATVSAYESASVIKKPSLDLAMNFSTVLNVSLDWLCGREDRSRSFDGVADFDSKSYLYSLVRVVTELSTETEEDMYAGNNALNIILTQNSLIGFVNRVKDLLKVYRAGSLTKDLYITCIDKIVDDFSDYVFDFDNFMTSSELIEATVTVSNTIDNAEHQGDKFGQCVLNASFSDPQSRADSIKLFVSQDFIAQHTQKNTSNDNL